MTRRQASQYYRRLRLLYAGIRPQRGPRWGTVFITRKCDLRCQYCFVPLDKSKDISTEQWVKIIDRMAEWGFRLITVVGGEPTLRKDLDELLRHMVSRRLIVYLHSNFRRLDAKRIDALADTGLFALTGSLDSLNGFEKSDPNHVLDLLSYAGSRGILPVVSSVLTSRNAHELPAIARLAIDRGILFNFGLYQHVGGAFSIRDERLIPPRDTLLAIVKELRTLKRQTGAIRTTAQFMDPRNLELYYSGWKCNPHKDNWLVVNNDGTLMRCQEYSSPIRLLGIDSLSDPAWREAKVKIVRGCPGCYHHCYFDAEVLRGIRVLRESRGIMRAFAFDHHAREER